MYKRQNLFSIFTNFLTSIRNFCSERESDNDIICYLDFIERFKSNQFIEETEEALAEGNDGNGVRTVSYTHLDVYKRQNLYSFLTI